MRLLCLTSLTASWCLSGASVLLVHRFGFTSWKMVIPLTLLAVGLLGWTFTAMLASVLAYQEQDRTGLDFQLYAGSVLFSALPLTYFAVEFLLFPGAWTEFLMDWLQRW